jgi:hypothetical protein
VRKIKNFIIQVKLKELSIRKKMKFLNLRNFFPKFNSNELFATDFRILNFFGFWPGNLISLRSAIIFISSFAFELFPEIYFLYEYSNDIQRIFTCLHELMTVIIYLIKMSLLFTKRNKIMSLVNELRAKWNESE